MQLIETRPQFQKSMNILILNLEQAAQYILFRPHGMLSLTIEKMHQMNLAIKTRNNQKYILEAR